MVAATNKEMAKMTLTEQQRNKICKKIAYDINEYQSSDEYSFSGEMDVVWSAKNESYRIIPAKGKKSWAQPKDLVCYINNLSDAALIEYYVEDTGDEDLEELELTEETD